MKTRQVPSDRRQTRVRANRIMVSRFAAWQRWTPSPTAPLVRLVRRLAA